MDTSAPVEPGFASVRSWLREHADLDLDAFRRSYALRRLAIRVRRTQSEDLQHYAALLRTDSEELEKLLDTLTVRVTRFFRDPTLWQTLLRQVLPARLERGREPLRLLSAGCASGPETWSLAITALEFLRGRRPDLPLMVRGLDVDKNAVAGARRGIYPASALAGVQPALRERYFRDQGDTFEAGDELKEVVRFGVADLSRPLVERDQDVILCRNVLIYIAHDLQPRVVAHLAQALAPEGFLVLGPVERLPDCMRSRFEVVDAYEHIYRRLSPVLCSAPEDP